ncbi:MAG: cytochrome b [Thermaurantiacus sp.]
MAQAVTRYHPLLVTLHWLVAVMIAISLLGGLFGLSVTPNDDPMKPIFLTGHMAGGLALLAVMLVRLATRLSTAKPAPLEGPGWQVALARGVHWGLYLAIFAMLSTGIGMAVMAGLFPLLAGETVVLPETFETLPPHAGHELFSRLLIALILLHVAAAVWHSVRKDGALRRIWFGRRTA